MPPAVDEAIAQAREQIRIARTSDVSKDAVLDAQEEFLPRLAELSGRSRDVAAQLNDADVDPVAVLGSIQKLCTDTENLVIRYRKVDEEASDGLRKRMLEASFGQPGGIHQIVRNVTCGVYENASVSCLGPVASVLEAVCDVQQDLGSLVDP